MNSTQKSSSLKETHANTTELEKPNLPGNASELEKASLQVGRGSILKNFNNKPRYVEFDDFEHVTQLAQQKSKRHKGRTTVESSDVHEYIISMEEENSDIRLDTEIPKKIMSENMIKRHGRNKIEKSQEEYYRDEYDNKSSFKRQSKDLNHEKGNDYADFYDDTSSKEIEFDSSEETSKDLITYEDYQEMKHKQLISSEYIDEQDSSESTDSTERKNEKNYKVPIFKKILIKNDKMR